MTRTISPDGPTNRIDHYEQLQWMQIGQDWRKLAERRPHCENPRRHNRTPIDSIVPASGTTQHVILMQAVGRRPRFMRKMPGTEAEWEYNAYCMQFDHILDCAYDRFDRTDPVQGNAEP